MTTTAFIEAAAKAHKLWGGRFSGAGTAPQFDALNNSIGVDVRLWRGCRTVWACPANLSSSRSA